MYMYEHRKSYVCTKFRTSGCQDFRAELCFQSSDLPVNPPFSLILPILKVDAWRQPSFSELGKSSLKTTIHDRSLLSLALTSSRLFKTLDVVNFPPISNRRPRIEEQ